jgi:hypothetical protein
MLGNLHDPWPEKEKYHSSTHDPRKREPRTNRQYCDQLNLGLSQPNLNLNPKFLTTTKFKSLGTKKLAVFV